MSEPANRSYEFGDFRLSGEDGILWRGGEKVPVTQKAIDLLELLLSSNGRLVTRAEIIEKLWPETYVDENNLSVTVSMLRKALGDPKLIETIPRKGYRFIGDVRSSSHTESIDKADGRELVRVVIERTEIENDAGPALERLEARTRRHSHLLVAMAGMALLFAVAAGWWFISRTDVVGQRSEKYRQLAVLPFRDLSADRSNRDLSIGITDAVITRLASIRGLSVRPVSSVVIFADEPASIPDAAKMLRVDAILEGTIQKDGDRYRISAQLVNAADQRVLWADVFEEDRAGIFLVQKTISGYVADALSFQLTAEERKQFARPMTENSEAYRSYLLGRAFLAKRTNDGLVRAIEYFDRSIELDPAFGEAYAGRATTNMLLSDSSFAARPPSVGYPLAEADANRALEIDPNNVEATAVLGMVIISYRWNLPEGEKLLRRAIELNPSYSTAYQWLSWALIAQGRTSEAEQSIDRAAELDPTSAIVTAERGFPAYFSGDLDRAESRFREALDLDRHFPTSRFLVWRALNFAGKAEAAEAELNIIKNLLREDEPVYQVAKGCTLSRLGHAKEARAIYDSLRERHQKGEFISPSYTAVLAAELGLDDDVFADIEAILKERNDYALYLWTAPEFAKYRSDPRFAEIIAKSGIIR
ncbi:MAG: hypothetical protein DYH05_02860 [Acidobacteria bacterium ACB1]|nr:hypothetical protein [Pyrinomonadaceae bacterium]MCE7961418.1 hypothetical protein [Acidobacteria bacterium ACB1]RIJ94531.1 MAG: hypothetical protein DCC44_04190 [Acidobacteriota bacterium]